MVNFFLNTLSKHYILSASNGCGAHMRIWDQCSNPYYKESQAVGGVEVEGNVHFLSLPVKTSDIIIPFCVLQDRSVR